MWERDLFVKVIYGIDCIREINHEENHITAEL